MSLSLAQRIELQAGPRRAALAMPDTAVADAVARAWGECVWTHQHEYRLATLALTPVTPIFPVR